VALTVALPTATPVTSPVASTVATPEADVVHTTGRSITAPASSRSTGVMRTVRPGATAAGEGESVMDATTDETVTVADPTTPSAVAVTLAWPGFTPWTSPLPDTSTTAPAPALHVTVGPVMTAPAASLSVAVS
jgi:hypothetical protein